jgi:hypothetical protein
MSGSKTKEVLNHTVSENPLFRSGIDSSIMLYTAIYRILFEIIYTKATVKLETQLFMKRTYVDNPSRHPCLHIHKHICVIQTRGSL